MCVVSVTPPWKNGLSEWWSLNLLINQCVTPKSHTLTACNKPFHTRFFTCELGQHLTIYYKYTTSVLWISSSSLALQGVVTFTTLVEPSVAKILLALIP